MTVPAPRRPSHRAYDDLRIRAARGSTRRHGEDASHVALTASERAELGRLAQVIEFRTAGSLIFAQGDEAGYVYLLADGLIRICHALRNGERQVVAFHWPGDLFGLAEQARYLNSAETIVPSRVYRFQISKLERFLLKNPKIQDGFLVKATHDLRYAQRQIIIMGRFDIPHRLAIFLLDCSVHAAYFDRNTHVLTIPMSRYDIADYLGTSAETVTRSFTRLERAGLVRRLTARTVELAVERLRLFLYSE